jgi:hypothetical protein
VSKNTDAPSIFFVAIEGGWSLSLPMLTFVAHIFVIRRNMVTFADCKVGTFLQPLQMD